MLISFILTSEFLVCLFVCLFLFQKKMKDLVLFLITLALAKSLPLETDQNTEVALNEDEKIGKCFSF